MNVNVALLKCDQMVSFHFDLSKSELFPFVFITC